MKKILLSVVIATTLALTSCQFDDSALWSKLDEYGQSIKDHEQRISALEELCKQMNTNIEALQTLVDALEKRDYVTNVSEVRSNGEVIGYTISFGKSDTITIYHGQDGKDGANGTDGKDGYTPQIGVMKDTDNIYYWTIDGEWLLDGKGNKIQANGVNGTDGTNGSNGANGTNGVTPQLKIENDYWYVSYDNGATWVQLGKATGEDGKDGQDGNDGADGSDGADGEDGDSIFKSVTQDDEYVYFNLADGTMITLPKHDKENIQFEDLQVKAICCKNWDTNYDGELSYAEAAAVGTIGTVFSGNTNIIAFTELKFFTGITEIPASAFSGCTALWKIVLPVNIEKIGSSAFESCNSIVSIDIPNSVTSIGASAFSNDTNLTSVTMGNQVVELGQSAFYQCSSLANVNLSEQLAIIDENTFYYCSNIETIIIPNSVTTIKQQAFFNCTSIKTVEFASNSSLQTIEGSAGKGAFQNCSSLTSLDVPNSVVSIGVSAFQDCSSLQSLTFESDSKLEIIDGIMTIVYNGEGLEANGGAFMNCSSLKEVTIPASVHTIECNAFCNCTSLESVVFENNSNLKYLKGMAHMPYQNTDTYGGCFSYCKMLKSIILPKKVMEIGVVAFGESGLEEVYIESVVPPTLKSRTNPWGYKLSGNFPKSCIIFVPAQYYEVYKEKTDWKDISSRIYPYEF